MCNQIERFIRYRVVILRVQVVPMSKEMLRNLILAYAQAFTQSTNAPVGMLRGRLFSEPSTTSQLSETDY